MVDACSSLNTQTQTNKQKAEMMLNGTVGDNAIPSSIVSHFSIGCVMHTFPPPVMCVCVCRGEERSEQTTRIMKKKLL